MKAISAPAVIAQSDCPGSSARQQSMRDVVLVVCAAAVVLVAMIMAYSLQR